MRLASAWNRLDRSLRTRVLIPCAVLFAVTIATMVLAAVEMLGRDLEASVQNRAEVFVRFAADGLTAAMVHNGPGALADILSVVNDQRADVRSVSLLRTDGTVISSSNVDLVGRTMREERLDSDEYAVVRPIINEPRCGRCHGEVSQINGFLEARFSRAPVAIAKSRLAGRLVIAAIPSFLVLLAIAWWLLRREMVYADRMVRADRFATVGEMATGLAHEIRNPLAGLSGAMELLAEDLAGSPQAEVVGEMRHQVTRLTQTMDSLLGFARPPRPQMRSMNVNDALDNVLFLVRQQRTKVPISIDRRLEPSLPPVYGDPAQLEQVFLNVCLNACQAMTAAGGRLTVSSFARQDRVAVEIADTGPGIAPEIRPHLFTPFFTTRRDGNGLGLATSARIVTEHGGHIEFHCPSQGGTVFSIWLPIESARAEAA